MHQHIHTFRSNTHPTQNHPKVYLEKIQKFLSYNTKSINKNSYKLYAMVSMDETHIYLNMPASTNVQTIWSKKVNIKTQEQENWRIKIILTILDSRIKLAPLLI